jgi:predicted permease
LPDANPKNVADIIPLQQQLVHGVRLTLLLLFGAVVLVLAIACANVAALFVVRALGRKSEFAVRIALGASRSSLVGQCLSESLLLALCSGTLGTATALLVLKASASVFEDILPRFGELQNGTDLRSLAYSIGLSTLLGTLIGLAPALQFARPNIFKSLREGGRRTVGSYKANRVRNLLVVGQIALSVSLLAGSGLLLRSFVNLRLQPLGFEPSSVLTIHLSLAPTSYQAGQITRFFDQLLDRIREIPGVKAAAGCSALPANPVRYSPVLAEGQPAVPIPERPIVTIQMITPSYLAAMGIPLVRGRDINVRDEHDTTPVVLINEVFARRFFPGGNPVGKHVLLGRRKLPNLVVGVVGDIRNISLSTDPQPEVLIPFSQLPWPSLNLLIRTSGNPYMIVGAVRHQIGALDANQPVTAVRTLEDVLADERSQPKLAATVLALFALCALALSTVAVYGVVNYSVGQRTRELGVRTALGASRRNVLGLILADGLRLAAYGIGLGMLLSFALTRLLSTMIYGVTTTDPLTFVCTPLLFLASMLLASYVPAARAAELNPLDALREE